MTRIEKHAGLPRRLRELGCDVQPCGSRVTCSPAPVDTDSDYLVNVPPGNEDLVSLVVDALEEHSFVWEGNEHYQDMARDSFMSWRRGDVNLIVSAKPDFVRRHKAATAVCKRLNLLSKDDRVAVFQAVLYGNGGDDV